MCSVGPVDSQRDGKSRKKKFGILYSTMWGLMVNATVRYREFGYGT